MPLELGVWRIDGDLKPVQFAPLELEAKLEDILEADISIADPNWMVVGRQVQTSHGSVVDLLAIDPDGTLIVLELKRDKTARDAVAQVLDYGSWAKDLRNDDVAQVYSSYRQRFHADEPDMSIDEAFCQRFNLSAMPDELAESHRLVIVAAGLDPSTERVVGYLAEQGIDVNVIFFRVFRDDDRQYIARAWMIEPSTADAVVKPTGGAKKPWNGEYYASFGGNPNRVWSEAVDYGFFCAGGGARFTKPLTALEPGQRIWVYAPGNGYVGVGTVAREAVPIDEFEVTTKSGERCPIADIDIAAAKLARESDDPDKAEYMVAVDWLHTVPIEEAVNETGFFSNQNSAARPRSPKWDHTVERLKKRFGVALPFNDSSGLSGLGVPG